MKKILFLSIILFSFSANAEDRNQPEKQNQSNSFKDKWTFSATWENDYFADDDDNYTNGVRLSLISKQITDPHWLEKIAQRFPFFKEGGERRVVYSLGQSMFTPENVLATNVVKNQRPYAGWLYGSAGLIAENDKILERFELTAGIVGPSSLTYETQRFIHKMRENIVPRGWDNQLEDELGFIISYEKAYKEYYDFGFWGLGVDIMPKAGLALGNVRTHATAGATLRLGRDLPSDYGPPKIRPRLPGSEYFKPTKDFGWYFFADIEARAVARNIFLDGNTFRDSHNVDKKLLVGDLQTGVAVTLGNYRIAYTHIFRSKEDRKSVV